MVDTVSIPKVSIIVPIYNVEKYLPQCMYSLQNQTLRDIEIILVDDESPDNSPQMCDEYANQDTRVKVVHKSNEGLGMACNTGLEIATGEYVAFCDSDDWVDLNMYESMFMWAEADQVDVIFTGFRKVNDGGIIHGEAVAEKETILYSKKQILCLLMDLIASKPSDPVERHIPVSAKTTLYKRSMIESFSLRFNSERVFISEDLIWNCDILVHANKVLIKSIALYNYRDNTSSLSRKVRKDRFPFFVDLRNEIIRRYKKYCDFELLRQRADRFFISECRHYARVLANSDLTYVEIISVIRIICQDSIWQDIQKTYPKKSLTLNRFIIYELMSHGFYRLVYIISRVVGI